MTKREKELEKLERIIDHTNLYPKYLERGYCTDGSEEAIWDERNQKIARIIQQAGYTKKHFPVEELEAWLAKIEIREYKSDTPIQKAYCEGWRQLRDNICGKIKELKEE